MEWWPGTPHAPHRDPTKVRAIQRSLDWKRVVQIAAYLLQEEILDAPDRVDDYFREIYEPKKREPGREWPPKISRVIGYEKSEYPTFSNVLIHVNGAKIKNVELKKHASAETPGQAATLEFDEKSEDLNFAVIDGQHRVNGAYLAVKILREKKPKEEIAWDIPAEIFVDLDKADEPPRRQAQIFIDVNFYQKKVDRSLVADLFPTARGARGPLDHKERAQDLGRKLMLEVGPLVGMVQIPGIKYGVKDVVTLATLNQAIEDALPSMTAAGIDGLDVQASFLAQCLDSWLTATGRKHNLEDTNELDPANVAYQGRVVVSFLTLIPACIWKIKTERATTVSTKAAKLLETWLKDVMQNSGLLEAGKFLDKSDFKDKGFLGSGGLGRFRDLLWASVTATKRVDHLAEATLASKAEENRKLIENEVKSK
jgi:DGQHR domain-containing protein